jgi:hypothetical protein
MAVQSCFLHLKHLKVALQIGLKRIQIAVGLLVSEPRQSKARGGKSTG